MSEAVTQDRPTLWLEVTMFEVTFFCSSFLINPIWHFVLGVRGAFYSLFVWEMDGGVYMDLGVLIHFKKRANRATQDVESSKQQVCTWRRARIQVVRHWMFR
jgi:hypothetical protein